MRSAHSPSSSSGSHGLRHVELPARTCGVSDLYISVTPEDGQPELFAAVGDGARPTRVVGSYSWRAPVASTGLHLTMGETGSCTHCVYTVGVVSKTDTAFSITAIAGAPAAPPALLQDGVPLPAVVPAGRCKSFSWQVMGQTAAPTITLTTFSGLPVIYASYATPGEERILPSKEQHGGDGWPSALLDTALGQLEMHIPQSFVRGHLGTYLLVACAEQQSSASFALTAMADADTSMLLVPGRPQRATVASGSWRFFRVQV